MVLWRCLDARGVLVAYVRVINDLFDRVKIWVMTLGRLGTLPNCDGAALGLLSPFLFALVIDDRHDLMVVLFCMLFADDIVLINNTWRN